MTSSTSAVPSSRLHHVGVQTVDLDNSIAWYRDFFGCRPTWTAEKFSAVTRDRLPGIVRLTEVVVGDFRLHLFERPSRGHDDDRVQFQHLCVAVGSTEELAAWRARWFALHSCGHYAFARPGTPTEIVVDDRDVRSFYCFDVNGLEFEFTHIPGEAA
ncbi:VOC family protein [Actinophytocola sp.]|jgi:catechol 2,3-dioxygenase-like lactoylglutathione lyase family enzyme|uniref:VOC family protein n=1 Tax=Actinophytocola sp. TaxID=1872138 RepID=UPI002EDACBF4